MRGRHQWLVLAIAAITAMALPAQTENLAGRLRRVLGPSGQGEAAADALAGKNYAGLERILTEAQTSSGKPNPELLAVRAAVAFLEKDMTRAAATYSKAAELAPLSDDDSFTFAMALANRGDVEHARPLLRTLFGAHPKRALYVYWLGRLDYYQRRYQAAVDELTAAAQLDPGSVRVWDSLGLAYDMQGRMEQALNAFEKAVNANRTEVRPSPWPPNNLGYLLLRMERPGDAADALRESLRYDPQFMQAHYRLGRALEKQSRDAEAEQEYQTAVSGDPASPDACYALAFLLRRMHRERDAEAMFAEFRKRKERENSLTMAPVSH